MIKTFTAEGATAELAFNSQANFEVCGDQTRRFAKSGQSLEEFAQSYIDDDGESEGYGYQITIRAPKKASTQKKYKVINHINKESRKWVTTVNFINDEGTVLESATTKLMPKAKAIGHAKELATEHNCSISVVLSKEITPGTDIIAEVQLKEDNCDGKYFFFGVETTTIDTDADNG